MKKEITLGDLREAKRQLDEMIAEIELDTDFDLDGYYVSFEHLYQHLNIAWNSRDEPDSRMEKCTEEDFMRWRRFPNEFDFCT